MEDQPNTHQYQGTDLRAYIEALFDWWWLIAACAVLAGAAALAIGIIMPPEYAAVARIVSLKSQAEISLGSSIETVTNQDFDLAELAQGATEVRMARRLNSMAGIVKSGAIAQQVAEELSGLLEDDERDPSELLDSVEGRVLQLEEGGLQQEDARSDTIEIVVTYDDPQKAAAIANAWGREYETTVNQIYSEASVSPFSDISRQVDEARADYESAREALLTFLSQAYNVEELQRQLEEDKAVVGSLRSARQTAISSMVNKEVDAKQQLVNAYLDNDMQNRLFAFNKGQEAKRSILGTWIDAEVANRTAVINQDRNLRLQGFNEAVGAELETRLAIFQQQRQELLSDLNQAYARKQRLEDLLEEARLMQGQLETGGGPTAPTTGLSLLAFKSRVFSAAQGLPFGTLDLQVGSIDSLSPDRSAAEQIADLDGLIAAMEAEVLRLEASIEAQSQDLVDGLGYEQLELLDPNATTLSAAAIAPTGALTATTTVSPTLGDFIVERYADLFAVGATARAAQRPATDTALFAEIEALYPELFTEDAWMDLAGSVPDDTQLSQLASGAVEDLLQMEGFEDMVAASVEGKPLTEEIGRREEHIRQLSADLARLESQKGSLQKDRDLAWQTYSALLSKQQEIDVARGAQGTEVRFAAPAIPPSEPVDANTLRNAVLAAVVGLMLGAGFAFLAEYMDIEPEPFQSRFRSALARVRR